MQQQTPKTPETHKAGQQKKQYKQQPGKTNPTTSYKYPSQKPEQAQEGGKREDFDKEKEE